MAVRILQLSDPHLLSDPDAQLRGVPTYRSFRQVLRHLDREAVRFDWMILTGDLAHDEQRATYRLLRRTLEEGTSPWRMIPGNHDSREFLREVFPELSVPGRDFFGFSMKVPGWKLVGLDSRPARTRLRTGRPPPVGLGEAGTGGGILERPRSFSSITLRFPSGVPGWTGSAWRMPEHLSRVVDAAPQVQLVCCGHVHHEFRADSGTRRSWPLPPPPSSFFPRGRARSSIQYRQESASWNWTGPSGGPVSSDFQN